MRLGCGDLGRDRRRHAVAHGAAGRRELGLEAAILEEAVQEGRVVAGAVGDDRIVGQALVQPGDDLAHVDRAGQLAGLDVVEVIGARGLRRLAFQRVPSTGFIALAAAAKFAMPLLIGSVAW